MIAPASTLERLRRWLFASLAGEFVLLVVLLAHQSSTPAILGRYSLKYAIVLGCLCLLVGANLLALLARRSFERLFVSGRSINWTVAFVATVITFRFGDVGAQRLLLRSQQEPYRIRHPVYHHALKPGAVGRLRRPEFAVSYRINRLGMRDREFDEQKPPFTTRLLMLGDSFTEGWGVEVGECFAKQLERRLNVDLTGTMRYEVLNAGTGSFSPMLEYLYLRHRGLKLSPNWVIVNFDMSDLMDDRYYARFATFDSQGALLKVPPVQTMTGRLESFLAAGFIENRLLSALSSVQQPEVRDILAIRDPDALWDRAALRLEHTVTDDQAPFRKYYEHSQKYLKLCRDLCEKEGVRFALSLYPYGHQVNDEEWKTGRLHWGLKPSYHGSGAPFALMERWARDQGIPVCNLLPRLKQERGARLYYENDGHWTTAGHRVVAEGLYEFLMTENVNFSPRRHRDSE